LVKTDLQEHDFFGLMGMIAMIIGLSTTGTVAILHL
jgi:hypothetical protein